ncbi:MAG: type transport system ATP-binding protein [Actinomycetota bacterium]|jgi:ABC-2 type transport system ATP-binding protein
MTTIDFLNVTKAFGDLVAVHPVTAHVPDAAWWVIVGANGSGKTTLLQMTSGLQSPSTGTVCVGAAEAGTPDARLEVSYLSDSPAFYSDLSVAEHIDYLAGLFEDDAVADRAHDIMRAFHLHTRVDDLPDTFSRGMKQKTAIALALARPSTVLLLDEPTRGLDAEGAETMVSLLRARHDHGTTVMTVTHEPERFAVPNAMQLRVHEGVFEHPKPMNGD